MSSDVPPATPPLLCPPRLRFCPSGSESLLEVLDFDDAGLPYSLWGNYSCPVKYHNAPKDHFNAGGASTLAPSLLKPQFQSGCTPSSEL